MATSQPAHLTDGTRAVPTVFMLPALLVTATRLLLHRTRRFFSSSSGNSRTGRLTAHCSRFSARSRSINWCIFPQRLRYVRDVSTAGGWWSGVVVSTLALINEINIRRTRLVLRWVTVSGLIPAAGHLFQYVTNQPPKANSAFHLSGVGKWVPASAGKAKASMVHSVSGWTRSVQVKLWDPLRTRAICERLRCCVHDDTNPRLPYFLPLPKKPNQLPV